MANYKFELNRKGVQELLQSKEMTDCLQKHANNVLNRCPHGYGTTAGETSQRAKVTVGTRTAEAARDNNKNNTLLKALGS